MTRLYVIIALVVVTTMYAWNSGCIQSSGNGMKLFGLNAEESSEWHYVPCNGTTEKCGRLE